MKEYTIVDAIGTTELIQKVNTMIKEGWQPTGGICYIPLTTATEIGLIFYQALTN